MSLDYPSARERLAALRDVLHEIEEHQHEYDEAEWADIVGRLACRIAELEREAGEAASM